MTKKRIYSILKDGPNILSSGLCLENHQSEHGTGPQAQTVKLRVGHMKGIRFCVHPWPQPFLFFLNSGDNVSMAWWILFCFGWFIYLFRGKEWGTWNRTSSNMDSLEVTMAEALLSTVWNFAMKTVFCLPQAGHQLQTKKTVLAKHGVVK